jgi:hypothetical protein
MTLFNGVVWISGFSLTVDAKDVDDAHEKIHKKAVSMLKQIPVIGEWDVEEIEVCDIEVWDSPISEFEKCFNEYKSKGSTIVGMSSSGEQVIIVESQHRGLNDD